MRAHARNAAVVQHDDLVGEAHGGRALGDDERRRRVFHLADGAAQVGVRRVIQRGGAVIQNQDFRLAHERARDRQALALAAGEIAAALLHRLVKPLRLGGNHVERLRDLERVAQVGLGGVGVAPEQVAANRAL